MRGQERVSNNSELHLNLDDHRCRNERDSTSCSWRHQFAFALERYVVCKVRAYVEHGECQRAAVVPQTRDRVRAIAGSGGGASFEKADFAMRLRRNRNHVSRLYQIA